MHQANLHNPLALRSNDYKHAISSGHYHDVNFEIFNIAIIVFIISLHSIK